MRNRISFCCRSAGKKAAGPFWKTLIIVLLLIPVACSRKEPPPEATPLGAADSKVSSSLHKIYLVDADTSAQVPANDRVPLERATLTKSFGVVIRLYQTVPGQAYTIGFRLQDPAAKNVEEASDEITINPGNSEGWAYFPVSLNPDLQGGGKWKAEFTVSGMGVFGHEFEVQPLTKAEQLEVADHEAANSQAIKAFSHFWVAVPHGKEITYVTAANKNAAGNEYHIYQVAGLTLATKKAPLSSGDKLNGISYKGAVGFGFTTYRSYSPKEGWTEWTDLSPPQNLLVKGFNRLTGEVPANPALAQQAPGMRFRVQCRDGNWVVITDEQARFINGARHDDQAAVAAWKAKVAAEEEKRLAKQRRNVPYVPPPSLGLIGQSSEPPPDSSAWDNYIDEYYGEAITGKLKPYGKEVFKGDIFQPRIDFIATIAKQEASGRESIKQIAAEVQASPETLEEQQAMTIKSFQK